MDIHTQLEGARARIVLNGRFDFSSHRAFREATERLLAQDGATALELDLGAVSYLDSSALGMLLMLRDKAAGAQCALTLANCSPQVRQVLDIANFQKLFDIS